MKLRTKIMWICSIAVFVAVFVSDMVIFSLVKKNYLEVAVAAADNKFQEVINALNKNAGYRLANMSDENMLYSLKLLNDNYIVAFRYISDDEIILNDVKEIYNHTIFEPQELYDMEYDRYSRVFGYTFYSIKNEHYIIMEHKVGIGEYDDYETIIYRIADVTYVWDKLRILVLGMAVFMVVILGLVIFAVSKQIDRILQPLVKLNTSADKIAKGQYSYRIDVTGNDEVSSLGESFNKMAEAVEHRTNSIKESERKKTLFIGDLTHELKTPMTAISGYAQTLLMTKLDDEQKEEALTYIYEECERLERLSKKMMELLELENGGHIVFRQTPVRILFDGVEMACSRLLKEKEITLECVEQGECFRVDADLMTDALINLVDNAIKASDCGSRIVLRAEDKKITVQDFGKGIKKEEQQNILEPFYMVDKARSRKNGGAGLGLTLTATILKKHNCRLIIDSEINKGTTMILQFV